MRQEPEPGCVPGVALSLQASTMAPPPPFSTEMQQRSQLLLEAWQSTQTLLGGGPLWASFSQREARTSTHGSFLVMALITDSWQPPVILVCPRLGGGVTVLL